MANGVAGAFVVITATLVIVGSYQSMKRDVASDAAIDVAKWTAALLSRPRLMNGIFGRAQLSRADEQRIALATELKALSMFEIYDAEGNIRRQYHTSLRPVRTLRESAQYARRALRERQLINIEKEWIEADGTMRRVAMIYFPIGGPSGIRGVVGAELDTEAAHAAVSRRLLAIATPVALIAVLALAGLAVAGLLLIRLRAHATRIDHMALHDPLTNAPNRTRFLDALGTQIRRDEAAGRLTALHLVDLDRFKAINDTHGHATGDALLCAIVDTLRAAAGPHDTYARIGGDEFAFIQGNAADEAAVKTLAKTVLTAASSISVVNDVAVRPSVSVGTATSGQTTDLEGIQRLADAALYEAKGQGRNRCVLFTAGMERKIERRNRVAALMRDAIDHQAFEVYYQPVHRGDGRLNGFEALLRLPDGEGGMISPAEFIPLAEEMALAPEIGRFVLAQACLAATEWPGSMRLAVNLSAQQVRPELVDEVILALRLSGFPANRLGLEVTESLFIDDAADASQTLHALKKLGVRVAMDDFGTGFSSLSHLWRFPFDAVKVDRSCLRDAPRSKDVQAVLRTIVAMARAMRLLVVAEGIETDDQRAFAAASGFDMLQGYYFSRPMPGGEVAAYIRRRAREGGEVVVPDALAGWHATTVRVTPEQTM
ncbi:MAG: bifunctional diguanylate cyclase/phosphodiesterase [Pseudomonadota bacterium]